MAAFIVSSGTLPDAAGQLSPMRPKTCHSEGITIGTCHDVCTTVTRQYYSTPQC